MINDKAIDTTIIENIGHMKKRNTQDLGKGVMIQLGYIPYVST